MYGRYFHNEKSDLFILETVIESDTWIYSIAKMELQRVIHEISILLARFDEAFVEPILKSNKKRIDCFKNNINVSR